ncbi:dephospho-CoA kinase [Ilyomonas limi]|uniref:Dephospho-CoA kinase n=2 Tax=Ilyomonas limi TaxID=2575867 RepID=A0A4U3KWE6_9BACT|nr:dephospho-CoA kinase [Ilyomonas limi]
MSAAVHKPVRIGLTGGIGSGKSTVAQIFAVLGIPVFNADAIAKQLMSNDEQLRARLIELFGEKTYENKLLNTKHLAEKVFTDSFALEQLNAVVHPATIAAAEQWFAVQAAPYVIKEAALLFEAGTAAGLDAVIGVYAPQHLRIHRAIKRDGTTREQVLHRINRQIDEEIKMKLCDVVFINDEQQLLVPQVVHFHKQLLERINEQETRLKIQAVHSSGK